jgi:hypothetical protein
MAIVHHAGKVGWSTRAEAQFAYSRKLYASKHFSPAHQALFVFAVLLRVLIRLPVLARGQHAETAVPALRQALRVLFGRAGAPYAPPPPTAVRSRGD